MKGSSLFAPCIAKRLEGKVALITGAASGIGESTARLFVKHGAKVVIADIQDDLGRSVCDEIGSEQQHNNVVSYVHCDVTNEADVENAVNTVIDNYGKLDIMFSNAGIGGRIDTRISSVDYSEYKRVFDVNAFGAIATAKHAARVMIPAKRGSILFTSSAASMTSGNIPHPYVASKHAMVGLAKNLGVELGQYGIRVNCISPFAVVTPLLPCLGGIDKGHKAKREEAISKIANLKGAILEAEDIAYAALYLASDESKYVSGINLVVDGGYSTTNASQILPKNTN